MLKIGICDDVKIHRATLEHFVNDYFGTRNIPFKICQFDSGEALLEYYKDSTLDLIFLDIVMKQRDGIEVGREIRKTDMKVDIIFCTTHADFALEGYDIFAFGYMLKPFDMTKFGLLLDKYVRTKNFDYDKQLVVKSAYKDKLIPYSKIVFIESADKNIYIHLTDSEIIKSYGKLSELEERLSDGSFLKCHQSFIVNMKHITDVDKEDDVFLTRFGDRIPIRKKEVKKFEDTYFEYVKTH